MIIERCEQGTPEWHQCRLAIPTASEMDKVLTPGLKPSGQQYAYVEALTAEWISGKEEEVPVNYWMERGTELEPEARINFEFETGLTVEEVGFVYRDEQRMVGCSPDGLILQNEEYIKGAEIKCPKVNNHLGYAVNGACPKKYIPQVQSSMWICQLEFWDFISYHPLYGLFITEVEKDFAFHRALDEIMPAFIDRLLAARESDLVLELRQLRIDQETAGGENEYEWD